MKKAIALLVVALSFAGCGTTEPTMVAPTQPSTTPAVPQGGQAVELQYAPKGMTVPKDALIVEKIDQINNVTLVFSAPTGAELAAYYRDALPKLGFTIVGDNQNSLRFQDTQWQGGFTTTGDLSAITFRTDWGE